MSNRRIIFYVFWLVIILLVGLLLYRVYQIQPQKPVLQVDDEEYVEEFGSEVLTAQKAYYGDVVVTEIVSVYDGDTFTITIEDWPPIIGQKISVRLEGVDTPEIRDKRGEIKLLAIAAKDFVCTKLRGASEVKLLNMSRDKYFRIGAEVEIDGNSLGELLIEEGLAKPYDGGTKTPWTLDDYNNYINQ